MSGHDDWFKHDASEPAHQEMHGRLNPYAIMLSLAGTLVLVAVTIVLTLKLVFTPAITENKSVRLEAGTDMLAGEVREAVAGWNNEMSRAAWIDAENGVVRLPMDIAMDKVIREYASN
jgi:hypothetical protein